MQLITFQWICSFKTERGWKWKRREKEIDAANTFSSKKYKESFFFNISVISNFKIFEQFWRKNQSNKKHV